MDEDALNRVWESLRDKLEGWAVAAVELLPNVVVAIVVAVAVWFAGQLVRRASETALRRTKMRHAMRSMISRMLHFTVLAAGVMVCLSILRLDKAVTSVLAGAGVVGLALGFAFQDLAANFISGVGLSVKHLFNQGDIIETNEVLGVAESIEIRTTTVRTFDGKRVIVPNKKIFENVLVNHTDNDLKRIDIACGVSYGDDLEKVREVTLAALGEIELRSERRDPQLFFTSFGSSSIDYTARIWIDYQTQADLMKAQDAMIRAIKRAYDENDIMIPFPIRTLDFGIKGGETLAEVFPERLRLVSSQHEESEAPAASRGDSAARESGERVSVAGPAE